MYQLHSDGKCTVIQPVLTAEQRTELLRIAGRLADAINALASTTMPTDAGLGVSVKATSTEDSQLFRSAATPANKRPSPPANEFPPGVDVAAKVAAFREACDVSTFPRQIPDQYADASVRCVLGPDDDGRYGFGFDFVAAGGGTVRVRLPAAEVEKLLTWIRYPHRSQSLTSIGMPSFDVSIGGVVENTAPNAKSSAAFQGAS